MIIKLRSERKGEHVHEQVFCAFEEGQTFHLAGTLVFDVGEWQEFGAALRLGATQMCGQLHVIFEGDDAVVAPRE